MRPQRASESPVLRETGCSSSGYPSAKDASKKETIAQLEQQERELASWFAELQSQLEALFARPKTARQSAVRSSWN